MKTEHDIQNNIRLELSKLGWITFRMNVGKVKMVDGRWFDTGLPPGFSDLIALKEGRLIFLEIKTKKGKPSKKQTDFLNKMRSIGFDGGIVRDMKDVLKLIGMTKV